jgi:hypothetical protein
LEGIWVVTVHDCLTTTPDQAERAEYAGSDGAFGRLFRRVMGHSTPTPSKVSWQDSTWARDPRPAFVGSS